MSRNITGGTVHVFSSVMSPLAPGPHTGVTESVSLALQSPVTVS